MALSNVQRCELRVHMPGWRCEDAVAVWSGIVEKTKPHPAIQLHSHGVERPHERQVLGSGLNTWVTLFGTTVTGMFETEAALASIVDALIADRPALSGVEYKVSIGPVGEYFARRNAA